MPKIQEPPLPAHLQTTPEEDFRDLGHEPQIISGRESRQDSRWKRLPALPDLPDDANDKLRSERAELDAAIDALYRDEEARAARVAELRGRAIEKPPTLRERENLEKSKLAILQRRGRIAGELAVHATDCGAKSWELLENLEPETAVQDRVAEALRKIGFPVERRGKDGPFVDSRQISSSLNGVVRSHPDVVSNREQRHELAHAKDQWDDVERECLMAKAAAEQAIEHERQRIVDGL